jgi:hypothetical protein
MLAKVAPWVDVVELAIGAGCLLAAVGAFRQGLRLVAVVLVVASAAAIVHAVGALAS